jgi:hypothetical protein
MSSFVTIASAATGSPDAGMPFLFRATPQHRIPAGRPHRSQANPRAAGHSRDRPPAPSTLRTARSACIKSSIRAVCAGRPSPHPCAERRPGTLAGGGRGAHTARLDGRPGAHTRRQPGQWWGSRCGRSAGLPKWTHRRARLTVEAAAKFVASAEPRRSDESIGICRTGSSARSTTAASMAAGSERPVRTYATRHPPERFDDGPARGTGSGDRFRWPDIVDRVGVTVDEAPANAFIATEARHPSATGARSGALASLTENRSTSTPQARSSVAYVATWSRPTISPSL